MSKAQELAASLRRLTPAQKRTIVALCDRPVKDISLVDKRSHDTYDVLLRLGLVSKAGSGFKIKATTKKAAIIANMYQPETEQKAA